jgi:hypothetical protein
LGDFHIPAADPGKWFDKRFPFLALLILLLQEVRATKVSG